MSFSFLFYHIVNKVTERSRSDSFFSRQYQFSPIVEPCFSPKPRSLSVAEVTEQPTTNNQQPIKVLEKSRTIRSLVLV